ncbi:MAG TPA: lipid-A-disaccharide synthase, partial [Chromatiales bacterium]|nr:lipid-A-disaccharide synthase [Chromatiales bacterium]
KLGIPVFYYISPQVWAWRQRRVHKIRQIVDMMAVVFPFEADFYARHDVPVRYVGHPLAGEVHATADRGTLLAQFGLDPARLTLGLFPGSRRSEVRRLLPIILDSAERLKRRFPDLQFLLPLASTLAYDDLQPHLARHPDLNIVTVTDRTYDVMQACDAIITVSGTVTLEIALIGTPMVIINKLAWLTYQIVRHMVKLDHIGLCNIVAGEALVPELIQHQARPEKIAGEIGRMLEDEGYRQSLRNKLSRVRTLLAQPPEQGDISELALEMLQT